MEHFRRRAKHWRPPTRHVLTDTAFDWWYRAKNGVRSSELWLGLFAVLAAACAGLIWASDQAGAAKWSALGTFLAATAALAVVVLSYVAVRQNRAVLDEMREQRLTPERPRILVYFDRDGDNIVVVAENFGGLAQSVRFHFDPPLRNHKSTDIGSKPPFSTGIPVMRRGHRQTIVFAPFREYQGRWGVALRPGGSGFFPSQFSVGLSYLFPLDESRRFRDEYVLNIHHLMDYARPLWQPAGSIYLREDDGELITPAALAEAKEGNEPPNNKGKGGRRQG